MVLTDLATAVLILLIVAAVTNGVYTYIKVLDTTSRLP